MTTTTDLRIPITPELKEQLRAMAERDHRKMTDQIRHLLNLGMVAEANGFTVRVMETDLPLTRRA